MIIFYKKGSDYFTESVADKLNEMVVAHKIVDVDHSDELPEAVDTKNLPLLSDGNSWYSTEEEITSYLEDLHKDMKISRRMQSDSCVIDPDNPKECL